MAVQTVESISRLPPYMEGLQKRLLQSVFGTFDGEDQTAQGLIDKPITLPDFKLAGMDPLQQMALSYAPQMFGSYQPYMQGAQGQIGAGLGTLGAASTGIGAGLGQLADPSTSYKKYMDPYLEDVVKATEADIDRNATLQSQKMLSGLQGQGQGIGSGQRSGRSAVLEAELARNTADQKARTLSGLRSSGFQGAMGNMLKSSQLLGGLGGTLGQVGGMYNQFAGTTGDLGRLGSELGRADLGTLMNLGQFGRGYQQQMLDASRQNQMQGIMEPFTRLQLGSNFLSGMPSSGIASTFKSVTTPDANPFLSGVGAYTALQGVQPRGTTSS
tara:strand:- start:489 stop:1472 length:984 start_codon:yes stop_codon:yes gene_type:complete